MNNYYLCEGVFRCVGSSPEIITMELYVNKGNGKISKYQKRDEDFAV